MSSCLPRFSNAPRAVLAAVVLALATSAAAQNSAENVRYDYAKVLRVQPVHAVSGPAATWVPCTAADAAPAEAPGGRLLRVVGAVKGALGGPTGPDGCDEPTAFDVDYVYKGMKYRSRLAEDPGTRLRLRVSVMPAPMPAPPDAR